MVWVCVLCRKEIVEKDRWFTVSMSMRHPQHEQCYRKSLPNVLRSESWKLPTSQ